MKPQKIFNAIFLVMMLSFSVNVLAASHGADGENADYDPVTQYELLYRDTLNELYQVAINNHPVPHDIAGGIGIQEIANISEPDIALSRLGYAYLDISGDKIPELLIGEIDDVNSRGAFGSRIITCYTLKDNKPWPIFEGRYRSTHYYTGQGNFYYWGSAGVMSAMEAQSRIARDGASLIPKRVYFTGMSWDDGPDNPPVVAFYTNTTGEWNQRDSERLYISDEEFEALTKGWNEGFEKIAFTPFTTLAEFGEYRDADLPAPGDISIDWASNYDLDENNIMKYSYGTDVVVQTDILLQTDSVLKDFRFMTLQPQGLDEDYRMVYRGQTVYKSDYLIASMPLKISLVFNGDTPHYGISYTDTSGTFHVYAIDISGENGNLYFIPLIRK